MKPILGLFALIFCTGPAALGSVAESVTDFHGHILNDPLTLGIILEAPDFGLTIEGKDPASSQFSYKPNPQAYAGVSVDYGSVGFTVSTKIPGTAADAAQKGTTDNFDLTAHHSWAREELLFYYEDYKGFYLENPSENSSALPGDSSASPVLRPDIQLQHFGVNFFHAFSDTYIIGDIAERHMEKLVKGGSLIASGSFNEFLLNTGQPLVDPSQSGIYGNEGNLTYGRFITGAAGIGYGYVWPWTKDVLSLNLMAGAGPQWQWLNVSGDNRYRVMLATDTMAYLTYFHNYGRLILGGTLKYNSTRSDLGSLYLTAYVASGFLFLQSTF